MAACDYKSCDVCGRKTFYDAELNYDFSKCNEKGEPGLDHLGDWAVICVECAKQYETVVRKKEPTDV
jgi:hypothetical protein